MTPALEMLLNSRKVRTEQEVEDDFKNRQKSIQSSGPQNANKKKKQQITELLDEEDLGDAFKDDREKSQNLLLPSHIESMKEVYESLDKYNDGILKRADFLMALRTDNRVVDFIDLDAVKVAAAKQKVLTLDQILVEIERDEVYEMMNMPKQADSINHKEFITWREFLSYFDDYKEIEERNKKSKKAEKQVQNSKAADKNEDYDPEAEFKSLLE